AERVSGRGSGRLLYRSAGCWGARAGRLHRRLASHRLSRALAIAHQDERRGLDCGEEGPGTGGGGFGFLGRGVGLDGMGEEVTLYGERAAVGEEFELRGALDAFGDHLQAKAVAE